MNGPPPATLPPNIEPSRREAGNRKLSARMRALEEEVHSIRNDLEAKEKEESGPDEQIRLEGVIKRYRYGKKTMRIVSISQRFNDKQEIEKYDRATERGSRYCIVAIRFLPTKLYDRDTCSNRHLKDELVRH